MKDIEHIILEIRADTSIRRLVGSGYTPRQLHLIAEMIDLHGLATTRSFLLDKRKKVVEADGDVWSARIVDALLALLTFVKQINESRSSVALGKLVILNLPSILDVRRPHPNEKHNKIRSRSRATKPKSRR